MFDSHSISNNICCRPLLLTHVCVCQRARRMNNIEMVDIATLAKARKQNMFKNSTHFVTYSNTCLPLYIKVVYTFTLYYICRFSVGFSAYYA